MTTRLTRSFEVALDRARAWDHLARVEEWPSWARHIRSVTLEPPGKLTAETAGTIRLRGGIRSTFRMHRLDPPRGWMWVGGFLWLTVRYDHVFEELEDCTRIHFVVDVEGFGAGSLGRLFAAIYARNLDRAIENLVAELVPKGSE